MTAIHDPFHENPIHEEVDRMICHAHRDEPRRRQYGSDKRWVIRMQCVICGRSKGPFVARASVGRPIEQLDLYDDQAADAYGRAFSDLLNKHYEAKRDEQHRSWITEHDAYLRTPKWRSLRERVLQRCSGMCEGCRLKRAVEVHHLTYDHWQDELLFELVALCHGCHSRAHTKREAPRGVA